MKSRGGVPPWCMWGGVIWMMLGASGGLSAQEVALAPSSPTPEWTFLYSNTAAGGRIAGSKEALLDSVQQGEPIGVTWLSWHGEVSGTCEQVRADAAGRLECVVEAWCDRKLPEGPHDHGHRTRITSSGMLSSMVLAQDTAEEQRLWALGRGSSAVQWYRVGRAPGEEPGSPAPSRPVASGVPGDAERGSGMEVRGLQAASGR